MKDSKRMYLTNFKNAMYWLHNSYIVFDELPQYDVCAPACVYSEADEEHEYPREVFQYLISDCNDNEVEYFKEHFPNLRFYFSDVFNKWFLLVDHFGTPWEKVETETDLREAAEQLRTL